MRFSKSWIAWQSILYGRRIVTSPYDAVKHVKAEIESFERGEIISRDLNDVIRHSLMLDGRYTELLNGPR